MFRETLEWVDTRYIVLRTMFQQMFQEMLHRVSGPLTVKYLIVCLINGPCETYSIFYCSVPFRTSEFCDFHTKNMFVKSVYEVKGIETQFFLV